MRKNHSMMRRFLALTAMALAASPKEGIVRNDPRSTDVIPPVKRNKKGKWVAAKR